MGEIAITGLAELAKNLDVTLDRLTEAAKAAVYGQGVALVEFANRKGWVPIQTGQLQASVYATPAQEDGGAVVCEVGYGVEYAPRVHEREEARGRNRGVTEWLLRAANVSANALQIRLQESLSHYVRDGITIQQMLASGIPTTPQLGGNRGTVRAQMRAIRKMKRQGTVHLVRRWKTPRRGKRK